MVRLPLKTRQAQRGFTFIELIVVLVILAALSIAAMQLALRNQDIVLARGTGNQVAQFVNGLRSYLSNNPTVASGTYNGITWLQDTSCGGTASDFYLPCVMPPAPGLGLVYTTQIVNGGPNNITATVTLGPVTVNGVARGDLSGVIATTANGANLIWHSPAASATYYSFSSDPTTAIVTAIASTNTSADAHLRTDGSNTMNADITFNPAAPNRNINNAQTVSGERHISSIEAQAPIYRDSDDPANYYVDPTTSSRLGDLELAGGNLNLTDPAGTLVSSSNAISMQTSGGSELFLNPAAGGGDVVVGGSGGTGHIRAEDVYLTSRNAFVSDLLPKYSHQATYYVSHGSIVPKPACNAGGVPKILINPSLSQQRRDITGAYTTSYWGAANISATQWQVQVGTHRGGFIGIGNALASTYCYFS